MRMREAEAVTNLVRYAGEINRVQFFIRRVVVDDHAVGASEIIQGGAEDRNEIYEPAQIDRLRLNGGGCFARPLFDLSAPPGVGGFGGRLRDLLGRKLLLVRQRVVFIVQSVCLVVNDLLMIGGKLVRSVWHVQPAEDLAVTEVGLSV